MKIYAMLLYMRDVSRLRYDCEIITESLQLHNIAHQDHDSRCVPGAMRVTFLVDTYCTP